MQYLISFFPIVDGVNFSIIAGFPGYRVGDNGSVWSMWGKGNSTGTIYVSPRFRGTWSQLKFSTNSDGYSVVRMFREGRRVPRLVHQIVLECFVGIRPCGQVGRHKNGVRSDCRLVNLEWGTPKQNSEDMIRHGKSVRGVMNHRAKITEEMAIEIRRLRRSGVSGVEVAKMFGVSPGLVCAVHTKACWAWLPD